MLETFISNHSLKDTIICDKIIDFFESTNNTVKGSSATITGESTVDENYKNCWETVLDNNIDLYKDYTDQLQECCNEYIKKFPFCNIYSPWEISEFINIQKYDPAQSFSTFHTERIGPTGIQSSRHLVFMTYLNDISTGGETEFPQQNKIVTPKKGLTLIWPADWTHTHRGLPAPKETKYIVTGWFNYIN